MTGVRGRLLRGLTSSLYGRAVVLVGQIGLVPVLATGWGRTGYGEWVALTAAASYAAYGGMGLAPTVRGDMAIAHARGGDAAMRPTFQTAALFLAGVGVAILGLVTLVTAYAPIAHLLKLSALSSADAAFILRMLTLQIVIGLLNGVVQAGVAAAGRLALANTAEATRQGLEFLAVAATVGLMRTSATTVSAIYAVSALLGLLFNLAALGRVAPAVLAGPWRPSREVLTRIWKPTLGVLVTSFGYNGLLVQAPRVIMAALLGPASVASYAICVMLLRVLRIPLEAPSLSMTVEVAKAFGSDDLPLVRRILTLSTSATLWLAIAAAPVVVALGPPVIGLWSNGRLVGDRVVLAILALSTCAYGAGVPSLEALVATSRVARPSLWLAALAAPFLAACWFGARAFAAVGVAGAVAVFELAIALIMVRAARTAFRLSAGDTLNLLRFPALGPLISMATKQNGRTVADPPA